MAWGELKFDKTYRIPVALRISEYMLADHGITVPARRSGAISAVTITGVPVLFKEDDSREYVTQIAKGECKLIPHYIASLRSTWRILGDGCRWQDSSGNAHDDTIGIAAVVSDGIGVPMMFNMTAFQDTAKLTAYILYQNKLPLSAVRVTRDCPEFITSRWKVFRQSVREWLTKLGRKE